MSSSTLIRMGTSPRLSLMTSTSRRNILTIAPAAAVAGAAAVALPAPASARTKRRANPHLDRALADLERQSSRKIAVTIGDGEHQLYSYRGTDPMPMCSLFKTILVGALLHDHAYDEAFWNQKITFTKGEVVVNSPICSADADGVMTVDELADAALRWSDNTAGNLLLRLYGGPAQLTAYAASLGMRQTRLDRWEPELNTAIPGDLRDTSTTNDMEKGFSDLLVGSALTQAGRARLRSWMLRNQTSGKRLRANLPATMELADKTGAGDYGVVNDAGVYWSGEETLSIAVMTRASFAGAMNDNTVVARIGQLAVQHYL